MTYMSKNEYLEQAVNWTKQKSFSEIKSIHEDYDSPKTFVNKATDETIQADFSFVSQRGANNFMDIALKTEHPQKLVTRWKLLSLMASLKRGKLFLLAPKGHKHFTQNLVNQYHINAIVYSL